MKLPILNLIAIIVILSGLVLTVPIAPALAANCDGDDGNNSIDCLSNPDDNNVIGGGGDDSITVGAAVNSSPEVIGDGLEAVDVIGGNDTITVAGTADYVAGDALTGQGGTSVTGGIDNIFVTGSAGNVQGDGGVGSSAQGGNDVIVVSGTANSVEGDGMGATGTMIAGDDVITVENATSVTGDGGGGLVSYGGDDVIDATADERVDGDGMGGQSFDKQNSTLTVGGDDIINATAPDVCGDGIGGLEVWGGIDVIDAVGTNINGDCLNGPDKTTLPNLAVGGNDIITATAEESVNGDGAQGVEVRGGNDTITASADHVGGDELQGTELAVGGDDVIVANANTICGDCIGYYNPNPTFATGGPGGFEAYGGDDTITAIGFVQDVSGDGIWDAWYANGGNDVITINDAQYVNGDGMSVTFADGGNDQITLEGTAEFVAGDGLWDASRAEGGDDALVINGSVQGVEGDSIGGENGTGLAIGGDDTLVVNGTVDEYVGGDGLTTNDHSAYGGNDTITINGVAQWVGGDGVWVVVSEGLESAELACIDGCGPTGIYGGDDTIVINGTVLGDVWGDDIPDYGYGGDDNITINGYVAGNVDADGLYSTEEAFSETGATYGVAVHGGNDTVTIGAGGVSYGTVCQDIPVTLVNYSQGRVGGMIDGSEGNDSLNFAVIATDDGVVDALAELLSGLNSAGGSVNVGGQDYSFANFENLTVTPIHFGEGPTRLFDDGVVLAFGAKNGNGIDVCSGPMGWRVGTVDFTKLETNAVNQVFAAGNEGWFLTVTALGDGQYQVQVFNGQGVLQNDKFTFVHK